MPLENIGSLLVRFIPLIIGIIFHEVGHAYVAKTFGDNTAYRMGRVTFDPRAHIDPIGTIILPLLCLIFNSPILFGWAKPVPVNFENLNPKRIGAVAVSFAGVFINLLLAFFSALLLHTNPGVSSFANDLFIQSVFINVMLATFNLIPIPPLDGGRIISFLLPQKAAKYFNKIESYGFIIIITFLFIGKYIPFLNVLTLFSRYVFAPILELIISLSGTGEIMLKMYS